VVCDRSKALEMRDAGASMREIATAMQVGKGTIQRLLDQKPTQSAIA
jgi:hypothetical protein